MVSTVEKKSLKSCIIHIPKHLEDIAMMKKTKTEKKISKVYNEFKAGKMHSGSKTGPVVKNPKQALAIALSSAGVKQKKGKL